MDAKNRELVFIKDLKELENKSHKDTNFFNSSMDELRRDMKRGLRKC